MTARRRTTADYVQDHDLVTIARQLLEQVAGRQPEARGLLEGADALLVSVRAGLRAKADAKPGTAGD